MAESQAVWPCHKCGIDLDDLHAVFRFTRRGTHEDVCRWCAEDGVFLCADPLLPRPSIPPSEADKATFARYLDLLTEQGKSAGYGLLKRD